MDLSVPSLKKPCGSNMFCFFTLKPSRGVRCFNSKKVCNEGGGLGGIDLDIIGLEKVEDKVP